MNRLSHKKEKQPSVFHLLRPYRPVFLLLILLALLSNGLNLWIPKMIGEGIDAYRHQQFSMERIWISFGTAILVIFIFSYLQSLVQTYLSERVARDLRNQLVGQISRQSFSFIKEANPAKLLTNLTADVDSIKLFVSQAVVSITSSIFIIVGVSILLISIQWRLALTVMAIIPIIGITFFVILRKVRALFIQNRAVIDWLNRVIHENILGAALIRVLHAQEAESAKFVEANAKAKNFGLRIMGLFAILIPIIIFTANLASWSILLLGGHWVMNGSMTLGEFAAFNSYLALLIFPILVIGFMSNVIAQASASYQRIQNVLNAWPEERWGNRESPVEGGMTCKALRLSYEQKGVLKDISFDMPPGSKVAILGPTAAGKSQLLYLLSGLNFPDSGEILLDGHPIVDYEEGYFRRQIGLVFQDSVLFNMSIRENIAFNQSVSEEALERAIQAAELADFIRELPDQLETLVSERGTSLSGGQKQRIMLARALAIEPKILLLDDFTARVDFRTEKRILENIRKCYPDLTMLSVTQKISSVLDYDRILLLMDGELIAQGSHEKLMQSCPEYVQIAESQKSTSNYE